MPQTGKQIRPVDILSKEEKRAEKTRRESDRRRLIRENETINREQPTENSLIPQPPLLRRSPRIEQLIGSSNNPNIQEETPKLQSSIPIPSGRPLRRSQRLIPSEPEERALNQALNTPNRLESTEVREINTLTTQLSRVGLVEVNQDPYREGDGYISQQNREVEDETLCYPPNSSSPAYSQVLEAPIIGESQSPGPSVIPESPDERENSIIEPTIEDKDQISANIGVSSPARTLSRELSRNTLEARSRNQSTSLPSSKGVRERLASTSLIRDPSIQSISSTRLSPSQDRQLPTRNSLELQETDSEYEDINLAIPENQAPTSNQGPNVFEGDFQGNFTQLPLENDSESEDINNQEALEATRDLLKPVLLTRRVCNHQDRITPTVGPEDKKRLSEMSSIIRDSLGVPDIINNWDSYLQSPSDIGDFLEWRRLLSGETRPFYLDLEASNYSNHQQAFIRRTWDMDAYYIRLHDLGALKSELNISYYPKWTKTISHDWHFRITGKLEARNCKHLRLGTFFIKGGRWDLYIFFPNFGFQEAGKGGLTDEIQRIWVDKILMPAIYDDRGYNITQHHPRSFEEVRLKSRANQSEKFHLNEDYSGQTESQFHLPNRDIGDYAYVWDKVLRNINRRIEENPGFQSPILYAITYDCKTRYRETSLSGLQVLNNQLIGDWFWDEEVDFNKSYTDIAFEDVPEGDGFTLAHRACCNRDLFKNLSITKKQEYHWHGTSKANTMRGATGWEATLRDGGLSFIQLYNSNKDLFTTIDKEHKALFTDESRGVGLTDELLKDIFEAKTHGFGSRVQRRRILNTLSSQVTRIASSLRDGFARKASFGVRSEFRVRWPLLKALVDNTTGEDGLEVEGKEAYYIFKSKEVLEYIQWQLNRWLFGVYLIMKRTTSSGNNLIAEFQYAQSATVSLLLDSAAVILNSDSISLYSRLWHKRYQLSRGDSTFTFPLPPLPIVPTVQQSQSEEVDLENEDERFGLGFEYSLLNYNYLWITYDYLYWPTFQIPVKRLYKTAFIFNKIRNKLKNQTALQALDDWLRRLNKVSLNLSSFPPIRLNNRGEMDWNWLYLSSTKSVSVAFDTLYQSIFQEYTQDILKVILEEPKVTPEILQMIEENPYFKKRPLSLDYYSIDLLLGEFEISIPKGENRNQLGGRNGKRISDFPNTWLTRLQLLFDWEDGFKRGSWENRIYRQRTRQAYNTILSKMGVKAAEIWRKNLGFEAAKYILVIPLFQTDKLLGREQKLKGGYRRLVFILPLLREKVYNVMEGLWPLPTWKWEMVTSLQASQKARLEYKTSLRGNIKDINRLRSQPFNIPEL